jgi:WD40 repeat protein
VLSGSQPLGDSSLFSSSVIPFRVCWAARGRLLVSANQGATCSVWDAAGQWLRSWSSDDIPDMKVDPQGAVAAMTSEDGRVEVRNLDSGEILASFSDTIGRRTNRDMTSARSTSVHFIPQVPLLLSTWESREVKLWAWKETQSAVRILRGHDANIVSLTWRADGRTLATSGQDGRVLLWELNTGTRQGEIRVANAPGIGAAGAAFGPGETVFTMDSQGNPAAWLHSGQAAPLTPAQPASRIENDAQFQSSLADLQATINDPGALGGIPPVVVDDLLLTATRGEREVRVRDLKTKKFRTSLSTGGGRLRGFTTSGNLALLADDTGTVTGVEIATARRVFTAKVSDQPLQAVRATQGARLAAVDTGGHAAVISADGKRLAEVAIEKIKINDALPSLDGNSMYLACDDDTVRHRLVSDGGSIEEWKDSAPPPTDGMPPMPVFGEAKKGALRLALSSDGRYLAASFSYGVICLWESATGRLLYRFPCQRAEALAFSPDGHWLAAGAASGTVSLLRLDSR